MNSIAYPSKALTNLTTIATNDSTPKEIRRRKTYGSSTARVDEIRDHALQQVVNEVVPKTILASTISERLKKAKTLGGPYEPCFKTGPKGTIEGEIEDLIVEIILAHDVFGRAMNYDEIIQLANDLIRDTSSAEEIQKRKVRECNDSEDGEILGKKWIKLFLNRKKDRLKTAFPNLYEKNRAAFSSYDNFVRMYDRLEKALLLGKIAVSFVNRKLH